MHRHLYSSAKDYSGGNGQINENIDKMDIEDAEIKGLYFSRINLVNMAEIKKFLHLRNLRKIWLNIFV